MDIFRQTLTCNHNHKNTLMTYTCSCMYTHTDRHPHTPVKQGLKRVGTFGEKGGRGVERKEEKQERKEVITQQNRTRVLTVAG